MTRQTIKTKVAIIGWIIKNEEWIVKERPTHQQVADRCGNALGFTISHSTIGDIARSGAIGFDWPKPKSVTKHLSRTVSYAALCQQVKVLQDRVDALEADLGLKS